MIKYSKNKEMRGTKEMSKSNFSKNKTIISILIIIVLVFISIISYNYYQEKERQEMVDTYIAQIQKAEKEFLTTEKREEKINVLKLLLKDYEEYKETSDNIEKIHKEYDITISNIQKQFKDEYEKIIKDNTLEDIENINDKDKINTLKNNLINLLEIIKSEIDIVSTEGEVKKYEENINVLINSYDNRTKSIEEAEKKAEEERLAKEQAEKERLAKEQAEAKIKQEENKQNPNTNSSNQSNNNQNSNNSNSSSNSANSNKLSNCINWNDIVKHTWSTDPNTGEKIEGTDTYVDSKGNVYDVNGNFLYNLNDWGF